MGFKQKLFSPLVWGNLLAMLLVVIAAIIGVWYFLSAYTHHGESIEVPNIVGHQESDARYRLEKIGLKAMVVDSAFNKQQPAGCVLDQLPAAGRRVKYGREIYLTINSGNTPSCTRLISRQTSTAATRQRWRCLTSPTIVPCAKQRPN